MADTPLTVETLASRLIRTLTPDELRRLRIGLGIDALPAPTAAPTQPWQCQCGYLNAGPICTKCGHNFLASPAAPTTDRPADVCGGPLRCSHPKCLKWHAERLRAAAPPPPGVPAEPQPAAAETSTDEIAHTSFVCGYMEGQRAQPAAAFDAEMREAEKSDWLTLYSRPTLTLAQAVVLIRGADWSKPDLGRTFAHILKAYAAGQRAGERVRRWPEDQPEGTARVHVWVSVAGGWYVADPERLRTGDYWRPMPPAPTQEPRDAR